MTRVILLSEENSTNKDPDAPSVRDVHATQSSVVLRVTSSMRDAHLKAEMKARTVQQADGRYQETERTILFEISRLT